MPSEPSETRADARRRLAARFAAAGINSADLDARLLVCAATGIDHAGLVRDPDLRLEEPDAARLAAMAERRITGEPVSRIVGRKEFWGLPFAVSAAVLDPRPETEGLVASVIDALGGCRTVPLSILDLGVGSGAILAALLHELPNAWGVGIDRSPTACRVARGNIAALGLADRGFVLCGVWGDSVRSRFDLVVSNPPYVKRTDIRDLEREVRDHDPVLALDGGLDGLDAYRHIVPKLHGLLRSGGAAAFECGAGQGAAVVGMMRDCGLCDTAIYLDLAGHDRVVLGFTSA